MKFFVINRACAKIICVRSSQKLSAIGLRTCTIHTHKNEGNGAEGN